MRHLFRNITLTALTVAAGASLTSCHHKNLFYPEPVLSSHLQVVFDWQKAPEASPEAMAAYLYEEDGTKPLRFIFDNKDGGEIKAPNGTRHIIFLNADNNMHVSMRNHEQIETSEIYTSDAEALMAQGLSTGELPRSRETEDERYANTPGMIWGGRSNGHVIAPHSGMQTITLYPEELVCHYTVDIYDVENLDALHSSTVDATLSGMAEGYGLGRQQSTDAPVTMPFTVTASKDTDALHGEFLTFGECSQTARTHTMTVYMLLKDGSKWWHTYDVTDQVSQAPDPRHVHIVVRGLPLPEPPAQGTSVTPNVNEWQAVNINLHM